MNAAVLDFPPIEAPPLAATPAPVAVAVVAPVATLPISIKDAVLAQFKEAETSVLALAEKYRAVAFDVSTTKGMNEAKAARLELREKGRFAVQRAEKSVKADVNDLKRVMADEVERIVAIVLPVEEAIDAQIKAEEDRKAAAKAERDRIEAERVAAHQAGITKIRAYLARCQEPGMTAERIGKGIDLLTGVAFGPEWEEFASLAATAQAETLTAMRALQGQAIEREVAAAKAEADRIEQQRIAAENARVAAELAEQKRVLDAQAAAMAAQQKALDDAKAAAALALANEESARRQRDEAAQLLEQQAKEQAQAQEAQAAAEAARITQEQAKSKAKGFVAIKPLPQGVTAGASVNESGSWYAASGLFMNADGTRSIFCDVDEDADPVITEVPAVVAEVESDSTQAPAAPVSAPLAIDTVALLTNCQDALREALQIVQELVNDMDQTKGKDKAAHAILARVAELRDLGGI